MSKSEVQKLFIQLFGLALAGKYVPISDLIEEYPEWCEEAARKIELFYLNRWYRIREAIKSPVFFPDSPYTPELRRQHQVEINKTSEARNLAWLYIGAAEEHQGISNEIPF